MYLNATKHPEAMDHELLDLDTGKVIKHSRWANDVTGKYCIYVVGADGIIITKNSYGWKYPKTKILKGNIVIRRVNND